MEFKCLKCGGENYQVKSIVLPEKTAKKLDFNMGLYYFKVCLNCGFTEVYYAKILDKSAEAELCSLQS